MNKKRKKRLEKKKKSNHSNTFAIFFQGNAPNKNVISFWLKLFPISFLHSIGPGVLKRSINFLFLHKVRKIMGKKGLSKRKKKKKKELTDGYKKKIKIICGRGWFYTD